MAKTRSKWSESVYRKRLKEGRGQGELAAYKPWITIHDLASKGYATRILGHKTRRIHHLLSHNELYYFCLLDWSDHVLDIREQFPMRLAETLEIAAEAGIRHPWDRRSGFPYVMTTDFLVTTDCGIVARTVKAAEELKNRRVREKFEEIERRYWENCGIQWKIVTENQINADKAKNILWLRSGVPAEEAVPDGCLLEECCRLFIELYGQEGVPFPAIVDAVEGYADAPPGAGLSIFKKLAASGRLSVDLSVPINFAEPRAEEWNTK